jgi:hypothetical protein
MRNLSEFRESYPAGSRHRGTWLAQKATPLIHGAGGGEKEILICISLALVVRQTRGGKRELAREQRCCIDLSSEAQARKHKHGAKALH